MTVRQQLRQIAQEVVAGPSRCHGCLPTNGRRLVRAVEPCPSQLRGTAVAIASSSRRYLSSSQLASQDQPRSRHGGTAFHGWVPSRTHDAGQLRASDDGERVILAGWLLPSRKLSQSLSFFPLRDATGVIQLVSESDEMIKVLTDLPHESVVHVQGTLRRRPQEMINAKMATGEVEVSIETWHILNTASNELPFQPSNEHNLPNEELRAKNRHLDLRRPQLTHNLRLRSRVAHKARCFLHDRGFTEIETPLLLRSTPEGAREFLVPTRATSQQTQQQEAPAFYALPQSPQQPKQLLIASGVTDKYFQIAKCFRDEAGRKDRQPEFTQLDLEMAFVDGAPSPTSKSAWKIGGTQVRRVIEGLVREIWREAKGIDVLATGSADEEGGFRVLTYQEAMSRYGSDKPDCCFGLEILDLQPFIRSSEEDAEGTSSTSSRTVEILALRTPKKAGGSQPKAFSNKDLAELMRDKSGSAEAVGGGLERFKSPTPSPHAMAKLLLHKSSHLKQVLEGKGGLGLAASEVDVERLAQGIEQALQVGLADRQTDVEEEVQLFVGSRPQPAVGGSTEMGELRLRLRDALLSKGEYSAGDPELQEAKKYSDPFFALLVLQDCSK